MRSVDSHSGIGLDPMHTITAECPLVVLWETFAATRPQGRSA
jgi:hypothetical protein